MFDAMRKPSRRTIFIFIFVLISILCLVSYFNYAQKQKMYEKFSSYLPEGYFNPDDPAFWKIAIKVADQEIREMDATNYIQREQEKMKRMGFNITVTDEMVSKKYLQKKKELDFAKKELERLTGREGGRSFRACAELAD